MPERSPRVLIVEDDFLIAMDKQAMLEDAGCEVVGPVGSVADALEVVRQSQLTQQSGLKGALLDINLGGERVWPVTDLLDELAVPFVLVTGYDASEVPEHLRRRPLLTKPTTLGAVKKALREIGVIPTVGNNDSL